MHVCVYCSCCRSKKDDLEYAVKVISRRRTDCSLEVNLLALCQGHPNIVRLHEVLHDEVISRSLIYILSSSEV